MNRRNFVLKSGLTGMGLMIADLSLYGLNAISISKPSDASTFLELAGATRKTAFPDGLAGIINENINYQTCIQVGYTLPAGNQCFTTSDNFYFIPLSLTEKAGKVIDNILIGYKYENGQWHCLPALTSQFVATCLHIHYAQNADSGQIEYPLHSFIPMSQYFDKYYQRMLYKLAKAGLELGLNVESRDQTTVINYLLIRDNQLNVKESFIQPDISGRKYTV